MLWGGHEQEGCGLTSKVLALACWVMVKDILYLLGMILIHPSDNFRRQNQSIVPMGIESTQSSKSNFNRYSALQHPDACREGPQES